MVQINVDPGVNVTRMSEMLIELQKELQETKLKLERSKENFLYVPHEKCKNQQINDCCDT